MQQNFGNLVVAIILSVAIVFGWQYFVEKTYTKNVSSFSENQTSRGDLRGKDNNVDGKEVFLERSEAIASRSSVLINSKVLKGSIALRGLRFDDITLTGYKQNLDSEALVPMFSPSKTQDAYFAEIGWFSWDKSLICPDADSIWQSDRSELHDGGEAVTLSWRSPQGLLFQVQISIIDDYLFSIIQNVTNASGRIVKLSSYGLINRIYEKEADANANILHQGMIGAVNNQLQEYSYSKIEENKKEIFSGAVHWLGITDKYWLAAFIPDATREYTAKYNFAVKSGHNRYQADFVAGAYELEKEQSYSVKNLLFVGPKKVDLLDKYAEQFGINLFDRAIDFGWLYILTKPIFTAMNFFYKYVGNFGVSIMIVTVLIRLVMFNLANKSYRAMKKMKQVQPEMERLKKLYENDKTKLQQEIMALYKREKVNPLSGCLPLLVQIPVFFAIYKVLYVTIEMRHAPFFGWVRDLSAPDPTSIINLFGLLPFSPPAFLMIGAWPLLMALTMYLQQKMSPKPNDPVQAQVMQLMPLMFLFMFGGFPVGLLIYWSWNNILSIIQQFYINKLDRE
jgi:YidC/Oxa1 family membrane protein insertase